MTQITALFAKFGLFGRAETAPDAFDLRLLRTGSREMRSLRRTRTLFRSQP